MPGVVVPVAHVLEKGDRIRVILVQVQLVCFHPVGPASDVSQPDALERLQETLYLLPGLRGDLLLRGAGDQLVARDTPVLAFVERASRANKLWIIYWIGRVRGNVARIHSRSSCPPGAARPALSQLGSPASRGPALAGPAWMARSILATSERSDSTYFARPSAEPWTNSDAAIVSSGRSAPISSSAPGARYGTASLRKTFR